MGRIDHDFIPAYLADHYTRDDRQVLSSREIWGRVELILRHPNLPDSDVTPKIPLRAKHGQIVGLTGMSPRSFRRHFKTAVQVTPSTEVRPFRIGKACQLLGETDDTITTIAQAVGFRDHSQLAREFTRAMHLTPGGSSQTRQAR